MLATWVKTLYSYSKTGALYQLSQVFAKLSAGQACCDVKLWARRGAGIRRETSGKGTKGLQPCNKGISTLVRNLCELWFMGGVGGQFLRILYWPFSHYPGYRSSFLACVVFGRRPTSRVAKQDTLKTVREKSVAPRAFSNLSYPKK